MAHPSYTLNASQLAALSFVMQLLEGTHPIIPELKEAEKAAGLLRRIRGRHIKAISYSFEDVTSEPLFSPNVFWADPSNINPELELKRTARFSIRLDDGDLDIELKMRGRNDCSCRWHDEETLEWRVSDMLFRPMQRHIDLFEGVPEFLNGKYGQKDLKIGWEFAGPDL